VSAFQEDSFNYFCFKVGFLYIFVGTRHCAKLAAGRLVSPFIFFVVGEWVRI